MMKKLLLTTSIILTVIICTIAASAEPPKYQLLDYEPYVEDETTKIIDHVVYRLCPGTRENHYDVYDWFDTEEAFETVEEINIVPEIDGIKVKGIQCNFIYDDYLGHSYLYTDFHNYSVKKVTILDGRVPHALLIEMLTDEGAGTMFVKDMDEDDDEL